MLAKAVRQGAWLLIEDMHNINSDLLPFLSGIMADGYVVCGSDCNRKIHCGRGFRLFGTQSSDAPVAPEIERMW